jgi:flagellar biosynthesis/type III secretory pathway protein FliH
MSVTVDKLVPCRQAGFVPTDSLQRARQPAETTFAARHFAARRAGFLLRELARQQASDVVQDAVDGGDAAELSATTTANGAFVPVEIDIGFDTAGYVDPAEVERQVAEAEARGRAQAAAEFAAALDQSIAVLDAAGRELLKMQSEMERKMIVPLAQASLHIGSELARQSLVSEAQLTQYLESVIAAMSGVRGEVPREHLTLRLNPQDIIVLERAQYKPETLTLLADPTVPAAGVIVDGGDKVIDDRFENRLRDVREAVLAAVAELQRESVS